MKKFTLLCVLGSLVGLAPMGVGAAGLDEVYAKRADLRAAFHATDYAAIPGSSAGFLMNLEDWARQYGWSEYPELAAYIPKVSAPVRLAKATNEPAVTSGKYIVIDNASGAILSANHAGETWPIASITKLMTTSLALEDGIDVGGRCSVVTMDEVGGARLGVTSGTTFTVRDLLAATLVGSANNAANAVARYTGLAKNDFVAAMNDRADRLGLVQTAFVDPTGIELGNVSTAREVAYFSAKAFENENIRKFAGSSSTHISAINDTSYVRDIKSTNWMLYDAAYDDVYVTAGKTGFLNESGWNLVVQLHPMGEDTDRSLTVVALGAAGRRESFDDAAALARWTWKNFEWK